MKIDAIFASGISTEETDVHRGFRQRIFQIAVPRLYYEPVSLWNIRIIWGSVLFVFCSLYIFVQYDWLKIVSG